MENQKQPIRYMKTAPGFKPEFFTVYGNNPIAIKPRKHSASITAPNLTGRINAIIEFAEEELARLNADVKISLSMQSYRASRQIAARLTYAAERLHEVEFALLADWFRWQQSWAFAFAPNIWAGMNARNKWIDLHYNGRAPF